MVKGRVDGEFIGLCRAKSLDTRSAVGKNKRKKKIGRLSPALSATDFICVYNKFFHSNPGVRVKRIFSFYMYLLLFACHPYCVIGKTVDGVFWVIENRIGGISKYISTNNIVRFAILRTYIVI